MSNSIWKTPDDYNYGEDYEVKDEAIVVDTGDGEYWAYSSFYYMPHHCDDPDCCFADTECWKRWAKVTDLIAQADKAERLQKQLDSLKKYSDSLRNRINKMLKKNKTLKNTVADYFIKSVELGIELEKTKSNN